MDQMPLIAKVLSGKAAEREKKELQRWLAADEANSAEFEDIRLLWDNVRSSHVSSRADAHFYDGLRKVRSMMANRREAKVGTRRSRTVLATAVILVLLAFAITFSRSRHGLDPVLKLRFDSAPLTQVIHRIQATYAVTVTVQRTEILNCRFTGTLHGTTAAEDVIRALTEATSLGYRPAKDGRSYLLVGSGCPPQTRL